MITKVKRYTAIVTAIMMMFAILATSSMTTYASYNEGEKVEVTAEEVKGSDPESKENDAGKKVIAEAKKDKHIKSAPVKARNGEIDIESEAISITTGTHDVPIAKNTVIADKITYKGLIPGEKYRINGVIMKVTNISGILSGEPLIISGETAIGELEFTAAPGGSGSITVKYTLDTRGLSGTEAVIFNNLYKDDELIISHSELENEKQTIRFKEIKAKDPKEKGRKDKNDKDNKPAHRDKKHHKKKPASTVKRRSESKRANENENVKAEKDDSSLIETGDDNLNKIIIFSLLIVIASVSMIILLNHRKRRETSGKNI